MVVTKKSVIPTMNLLANGQQIQAK